MKNPSDKFEILKFWKKNPGLDTLHLETFKEIWNETELPLTKIFNEITTWICKLFKDWCNKTIIHK